MGYSCTMDWPPVYCIGAMGTRVTAASDQAGVARSSLVLAKNRIGYDDLYGAASAVQDTEYYLNSRVESGGFITCWNWGGGCSVWFELGAALGVVNSTGPYGPPYFALQEIFEWSDATGTAMVGVRRVIERINAKGGNECEWEGDDCFF